MDFFKNLFRSLIKYDEKWCDKMGFFNPYIDHYETFLSMNLPYTDPKAVEAYPNHAHVYDKLWIAKTQGLLCGTFKDFQSCKKHVAFPIFIKPRWGHMSGASKNCYKINNEEELAPFLEYPEMMWSEYLDSREGMTDFIVLNGQIVHQVTYKYSDKQHGFIDDWKYIGSDTKAPNFAREWVQQHMKNFSGVVNVQYRGNSIIEVSLRLARSGAYITSTQNKALIKGINNVVDNNMWDHSLQKELEFDPYYSFKCYVKIPILYLFPQYFIDVIMKAYKSRSFYEYYFEPAGKKKGMVAFQFMHDDFNKGMKLKKLLEVLLTVVQIIFVLLFLSSIILTVTHSTIGLIALGTTIFLFMGRFLNPFLYNYNLIKAQRQAVVGGGPPVMSDDQRVI